MSETSAHPAFSSRRRGQPWLLAGLLLLFLGAAAVRLLVGSGSTGWPDGSLGQSAWHLLAVKPVIGLLQSLAAWLPETWAGALRQTVEAWAPTGLSIMDLRLKRLVAGAMVGAALALSGVSLQALLRNPLAEPFILGLSSGAAVGVMVQMLVTYWAGRAFGANHVGATLGALASMLVVFLAGRRRGAIDPLGLLLTGVVLSTINGAMIMLIQYLAGPGGLNENLSRWMMGFINEGVGESTLALVLLLVLLIMGLLLRAGPAMDVATLSESEAVSLGVHVARLRAGLFIASSLLAAAAVVLAGPVAFVGLICPHLARLLLGPRHRGLLLGSALIGASLIVLADALSAALHLTLDTGLVPIGVFTAMIGGPAFLWMLRPQLGRGYE